MDPLEIDFGQICLYLFCHLEPVFFSDVICSLHRESSQDETLVISCSLLFSKTDFELKNYVFEWPAVVLSNWLPCSSQVCLGIKESTEPETRLTEVLWLGELHELLNTFDKVNDPGCRSDVGYNISSPLLGNDFSMEIFRKLLQDIGLLSFSLAKFQDCQQVFPDWVK